MGYQESEATRKNGWDKDKKWEYKFVGLQEGTGLQKLWDFKREWGGM